MKYIYTFLFVLFLVFSCKDKAETSKKESTTETITEVETTNATKDQQVVEMTEEFKDDMNKDMQELDMPEEEKEAFMEKVEKNMKEPLEKEPGSLDKNTEKTIEQEKNKAIEMVKEAESIMDKAKEKTTKTATETPEKMDKAAQDIKEKIVSEVSKVVIDQSPRSFVNKDYTIKGNWSLKVEGDKTFVVLHDNFKTKNGPDLKVFLSKQTIATVNGKNALNNAILLKTLKSNKGGQRYLIPAALDISEYKSVLIHCEKYSVLWGGGSLF